VEIWSSYIEFLFDMAEKEQEQEFTTPKVIL